MTNETPPVGLRSEPDGVTFDVLSLVDREVTSSGSMISTPRERRTLRRLSAGSPVPTRENLWKTLPPDAWDSRKEVRA